MKAPAKGDLLNAAGGRRQGAAAVHCCSLLLDAGRREVGALSPLRASTKTWHRLLYDVNT